MHAITLLTLLAIWHTSPDEVTQLAVYFQGIEFAADTGVRSHLLKLQTVRAGRRFHVYV